MSTKLIWGILGGLVIGAAYGNVVGDTTLALGECIASGAIAAWCVEWIERFSERPDR